MGKPLNIIYKSLLMRTPHGKEYLDSIDHYKYIASNPSDVDGDRLFTEEEVNLAEQIVAVIQNVGTMPLWNLGTSKYGNNTCWTVENAVVAYLCDKYAPKNKDEDVIAKYNEMLQYMFHGCKQKIDNNNTIRSIGWAVGNQYLTHIDEFDFYYIADEEEAYKYCGLFKDYC